MAVDPATERTVRGAVNGLLTPAEPVCEIRPLSGGVGNRSYLVRSRARRWVVRLAKAASAGSVLDVTTEHRVTAQAAAAGLAPTVVASDPQTGVLVTSFITHARTWTDGEARWHENIARIAGHLRALHRLRADIAPFEAARVAQRYIARASDAPPLAREQDRWADELLVAARRYDASHGAGVLCHNDLVAANILDDGRLWLVDFEYAVLGAPILDLAGVAGMNDYDTIRRRRLIDAYFAGSAPDFDEAELDTVVRLVRLLAYFWAVACASRADDAEPFRRFGEHTAAVLRVL